VLLLVTGLAVAAAAPATAHHGPRFRAMTYNMYLGADLAPLFSVPPDQITAAAAAAWQHVQDSDVEGRATALAEIIATERPLVVGLQEAALWETAPLSTSPVWTTAYDPVGLLQAALAGFGAPYRVAVVSPRFSGALPVSATTMVRFTDRDVILVRADLPPWVLRTAHPRTYVYSTLLPISVAGQAAELTRGWQSLAVRYRGTWFRFVNTHIEGYHPDVRMAQAYELSSWLAASHMPTVLTGDVNSYRDWAGDSWQQIVGIGRFTDAWLDTMPGVPDFTASFGDDLMGLPSELDHTVDYVFFRGRMFRGIDGSGEVVGEEIGDQTPEGRYPSDHAGVVVGFRMLVSA
jgi:endonuclease/exonuclease/phosphatase family metal-dependent hydrolase